MPIKLSELKVNPKNPRLIKDEKFKKLVKSLKEDSWLMEGQPIIIDNDNMILAGNMRYKALEHLGYSEIDDKWVKKYDDLTEDQKKRAIIKTNVGFGEWDWDILANEWVAEDLGAWGMDLPNDFNKTIREDDAPEVSEEEPISKLGEIYQLGKHRLMCGSSTDRADVANLMGGEKAEMVFTDPPYNVDYTGCVDKDGYSTIRRKIMNDKMSADEFYQFLYDVSKNIIEFTKGGIYICMSGKELGTLKKAFEDAGGHWQTFIIWVKNSFNLSRSDYQNIYEPILYGWTATTKNHYFIGHRDIPNVLEDIRELKTEFDGTYTIIKFQGFEVKIKGKVEGEVRRKRQKTDIWRYDKPNKSEEHPTMKPVRLCAEAIKNSSKKEELVLDLFGGSGSTLIACEQLGRMCYMMELDPKYVDVIRKRYWKFINNDNEDGWEEGTKKK